MIVVLIRIFMLLSPNLAISDTLLKKVFASLYPEFHSHALCKPGNPNDNEASSDPCISGAESARADIIMGRYAWLAPKRTGT